MILVSPNGPLWADWQSSLLLIGPVALVACAVYVLVVRAHAGAPYAIVLLAFLGADVAIFMTFNLLGAPVSSTTEARHFRPAGLILLPGVLLWIAETPRSFRVAASLVVALLCIYGPASYVTKWRLLRRLDTVGV